MSSFLIPPHELVRGTYITAKIQAYNSRGWSTLSDISDNGPKVQTIPDQMSPPTKVSGSSSATKIVV